MLAERIQPTRRRVGPQHAGCFDLRGEADWTEARKRAQLRGRPIFEKALLLLESTVAFDHTELSLLNDPAHLRRPR